MCQPVAHADRLQRCPSSGQCFGTRHTANDQRHCDVFFSTELRQQMVELINKTERAVPDISTLLFAMPPQQVTENANFAGSGCIQSAQ